MKRKTMFVLLLALGLVSVLGVGIAMARRAQAQELDPDALAPLSPQAAVGTAFTYQGRLIEGSTPVNGTCNLTFALYDAAGSGTPPTGGTQIGTATDDVEVSDGYFSQALDFGTTAFTGDARWLQITVNSCDGGGSSATLSPRVALNPAPYALSLRPGASVQNTAGNALNLSTSATNGVALSANSSATSGNPAGVYGASSAPGGAGVSGYNNSSSAGYGVYGGALNGIGVYGKAPTSGTVGIATAGSGFTRGAYGESASTNGTGVYGKATASSGNTAGVLGENDSTSGVGVAGYADANSGTNYGVYGASYSSAGYGVYGTAPAIGVYGTSQGSGVSGKATSAGGGIVFGVEGEADSESGVGVCGHTNGSQGAGGKFENLYTATLSSDAVGVWIGSSMGDLIQGYTLDQYGYPSDLRFRVTVTGNVHADGSYLSPAADFAEMLPAAAGLEPGDVLVVGLDGQLTRSAEPYASAVVGVYSTRPAFIGGAGEGMSGSGKVPLAVVGIVPTKVSCENGPILPGDLLVTSSTPGHAMSAHPNPPTGTVVGKALEGLNSGTGFIQMLVLLQ